MSDARKIIHLSIVLCLGLQYLPPSSAEEPREWTSSGNGFKVSATFVSATETEVCLRRVDTGKEIVVPIAKLSGADRLYIKQRLEDQQSIASAKAKPSSADTKLRIEPIDAEHIVLHPYGVLPILEPGVQWSITSQNPPRVKALLAPGENGNAKRKMNDRVIVEIHPFISAGLRADFITKRNDQLAREMRTDSRDSVMSSIDGGVRDISDEYQIRLNQFTSEIDACGQYIFLKDKTLVVEAMSYVNTGRSMPLVETVVKEMKKDQRWYQEPTLDPQIKAAISELIDKVKKCHARNDAKGAFELLAAKSDLAKHQANPAAFRALIAQFEITGLPPVIEALKAIDWKTAKYHEAENAVSFEGCPFRFRFVDDKWYIQP